MYYTVAIQSRDTQSAVVNTDFAITLQLNVHLAVEGIVLPHRDRNRIARMLMYYIRAL